MIFSRKSSLFRPLSFRPDSQPDRLRRKKRVCMQSWRKLSYGLPVNHSEVAFFENSNNQLTYKRKHKKRQRAYNKHLIRQVLEEN